MQIEKPHVMCFLSVKVFFVCFGGGVGKEGVGEGREVGGRSKFSIFTFFFLIWAVWMQINFKIT